MLTHQVGLRKSVFHTKGCLQSQTYGSCTTFPWEWKTREVIPHQLLDHGDCEKQKRPMSLTSLRTKPLTTVCIMAWHGNYTWSMGVKLPDVRWWTLSRGGVNTRGWRTNWINCPSKGWWCLCSVLDWWRALIFGFSGQLTSAPWESRAFISNHGESGTLFTWLVDLLREDGSPNFKAESETIHKVFCLEIERAKITAASAWKAAPSSYGLSLGPLFPRFEFSLSPHSAFWFPKHHSQALNSFWTWLR